MSFEMDEIEMYDFTQGDEFSDFKLIVNDKPLYVHKAILANVSPVFKRMFTSQFRESAENEAKLTDKNYNEILELLKIIYPNCESSINESNIESLLRLSDEYRIIRIKIAVEKFLIKKIQEMCKSKLFGQAILNQIEHLTYLLNLSEAYNLKNLRVESLAYLSNKFSTSQLESNQNFVDLSEQNRMEIFRIKLDLLEEKLKSKDGKIKSLSDECMKQKFEIKRLETLNQNLLNNSHMTN